MIFSTDSQAYWDDARRVFGEDKLVLDRRDADEAGDRVKIFDYVKGARAKLFRESDTAFVLCLPTVPLRTSAQIDEAVDLFRRTGKPVFSATDLVGYLACEHLTALERAALAGLVKRPVREDRELDVIRRRGFAHEARFLEDLRREAKVEDNRRKVNAQLRRQSTVD